MVNSPLIRPAISWGGSFGGGTLGSHDETSPEMILLPGAIRLGTTSDTSPPETLGMHLRRGWKGWKGWKISTRGFQGFSKRRGKNW